MLIAGPDRQLRLELYRCLINPELDQIDFVVSFVMTSGIQPLLAHLERRLADGARLRVLTSDYLDVTEPEALEHLLALAARYPQQVGLRLFSDPSTSFHPKAYLFTASNGERGAAFVGSSNLSAAGLETGIEWSIEVADVSALVAEFDRLWDDPRAAPLTPEWLESYRIRRAPQPLVESLPGRPAPTSVQREALEALEQTRQRGFRAALVSMATGLGKTWLAAFDSSRPSFRRVLFVAHRDELLEQAAEVFARVRPASSVGFFRAGERQPDAEVVFASVQTLVRHLGGVPAEAFDYVVVDEFHHAAARTYREVLGHLRPRFLLGITATPERLDGADLLALCGDNHVFSCDLVEGIERHLLSPFRYVGLRDAVDYAPIPWRSGRFDPAALSSAVETHERARLVYERWNSEARRRTLAFCVSTTHADFMAAWFAARGVRTASVHSGSTSADRAASLEALEAGDLDVLFSVDLFNEGVDLPAVDAVLMLRPTESPVVFLQQLGRGLRRAEGKTDLLVLDLVGNHRSFLSKPVLLFSLLEGRQPGMVEALGAVREGTLTLPPGCSVEIEPEAIDLLAELARAGRRSALAEYCLRYAEEWDRRPTAAQAFAAGVNPASARPSHRGWFGLLRDLDLLEAEERAVVDRHGDFLHDLELESMTRSYKVPTLRALLTADRITAGIRVDELVVEARRVIEADPRMLDDVASQAMPDPTAASDDQWRRLWREMPIHHLTTPTKRHPRRWFRVVDERFRLDAPVPTDDAATLADLGNELLDYLLLRYFQRSAEKQVDGCVCHVLHSSGRPILNLGGGDQRAKLPHGEAPFVADGRRYVGRFVKHFLNVAWEEGDAQQRNALPDLLRRWFGENAGAPGTSHRVAFRETDRVWRLQPLLPAARSPASGAS